MNKVLPKYTSAFTDAHGIRRIRFRRTGWETRYVHAEPGTPEFTAAYREWEAEGRKEIAKDLAKPGSFDDLIERFYRSKHWQDIKETTQYTYRGEIERFRAKYGGRSASKMTAKHVGNLIAQMSGTPSAANNLRKRLGQLFKFSIQLGWRTDNPASVVSGIRVKSQGYPTWQEEHIAQFEAHWPRGTKQRLAFDLALYTAQRRSDVRIMGPQHVRDGAIAVKQLKTGRPMMIPIHPELAASIASMPVAHLAFITTEAGALFSPKSFGMWFAKQAKAAGLVGYSMHGLRKAASRRMAETGLTNQEIKAITGHVTDSEVARYTREAEQALIARRAMAKMSQVVWLRGGDSDLATASQDVENK